jgi:CRISPR/Cas system-associated endonuclease Cas3-HD
MKQGKLLSRTELHDLVWSDPTSVIAERFSISGVALRKACLKAAVPVPQRGYWAKLRAGKRVTRLPLPKRPPGMSDDLVVGGRGYYGNVAPTEEELLGPVPGPPIFNEAEAQVRTEATALTARARAPRDLSRPHPAVERLLRQDQKRNERYLSSTFSMEWDKPHLVSALARRRLRILSGLFMALDKAGGKPMISDPKAEEIAITIHDAHVPIRLTEVPSTSGRRGGKAEIRGRSAERLRFAIRGGYGSEGDIRVWEDSAEARIELRMPEIAAEIVVQAELNYRAHCIRMHEWRVEQKAHLLAEREQRRIEAERKEKERVEALARERIERLLTQAEALRKADAIREYVLRVEERISVSDVSISAGELAAWKVWALATADEIDPVVSGEFRIPIAG